MYRYQAMPILEDGIAKPKLILWNMNNKYATIYEKVYEKEIEKQSSN